MPKVRFYIEGCDTDCIEGDVHSIFRDSEDDSILCIRLIRADMNEFVTGMEDLWYEVAKDS